MLEHRLGQCYLIVSLQCLIYSCLVRSLWRVSIEPSKGFLCIFAMKFFFIVIRMCLPRNVAKCSGDFYICNANILRTFNNTGVRSDMRPGFFLFGSETPQIRVFFSKWINYISRRKKSLKTEIREK